MTKLSLRYDLRSFPGGAPLPALYRAALDQCAWADEHGFSLVNLSEHHGSEDGYCPSPLVLASAVAARTERVRIQIAALILPLHDPVRIAEDAAVVDQISNGRLDLVIGAGYRQQEFAMFEKQSNQRGRAVEDGVALLREAWTGEEFQYRGTTVRVTPRPVQRPGPPLFLGGSSEVAARRAARIGDGFIPARPGLDAVYREECAKLGRDPGPELGATGPLFLYVAEDPDAAWATIAPHALHEMNTYGGWLQEAATAGPYEAIADADVLRMGGLYEIVTPEACVELIRGLGPNGSVSFHPLMGGLDPDVGWAGLELFASAVLPHIET
jgi:alkanesulfonate monooxygenase SsuD/methylene tetrahydromethanopterin reductase-like flavin-dependent oxidoreductase (luciferase family)